MTDDPKSHAPLSEFVLHAIMRSVQACRSARLNGVKICTGQGKRLGKLWRADAAERRRHGRSPFVCPHIVDYP
jgi:hypothetical protein